MPVSLATLTQQTQPITLAVGDVEIAATYYPDRISGADLRMLLTMREQLQAGDGEQVVQVIQDWARFLAHVLASWELVEEDGGPVVPIDEERIFGLGAFIVGALAASFFAEMRLGGQSGNRSQRRSQPTRTNRSRKS